MLMRGSIVTAAAVFALASAPLRAQSGGISYKTIEIANAGVIAGRVVWEGEVPKEAATEVPVGIAYQAPCRCRKVSLDRLIIDEKTRGVADCVVYLEKIEADKPMPPAGIDLATGKDAVLDQVGCRYVPSVMIVPPGTQLIITSSDNTSHNVNARMGPEQRFNLLITRKGAKEHGPRTSVGNKPGVISLSCNAGHPWMSGYIHVAAHPYYAITDGEGRYEIRDVPPGGYKLICWHANWTPRLLRDPAGTVTEVQYARAVELSQRVTVSPGAKAGSDFTLSAASAQAGR